MTLTATITVEPSIAAPPTDASASVPEVSWPQFRGPTYDAHSIETGLADRWPQEGPPVLWTLELGQGYSSFAVVGEHLFTQTQTLYQQQVVCLDRRTGKTIWSFNYGWPHESAGLYPGPRGTPTWHAGRIYFAAPDGQIGCLDATTGRKIWSCNPRKAHHGRGTDFGYAASPLVIDDKVIVPVGGVDASVVALNINDGSTVWAAGNSSASYATPFPITIGSRKVVIVPLENSLAAFEIAAGRLAWEIEFSLGYDEHSAAPLYREPLLFFASPFHAGAKCYRLTDDHEIWNRSTNAVGDKADANAGSADATSPENTRADAIPTVAQYVPEVVWDSPKFSNDVCSSVLVDDRIYGFDLKDAQSRVDRPSRGEFRCLDLTTGRILWSTNKVGQCSMIVADGKLILFTDGGELILARPSRDEYIEMARTRVFHDEICWTSPALHRGCIYLRTQNRAVCLYLGEEPLLNRQSVQQVSDIPHGRGADARWLIGGEREFPATVPDIAELLVWYEWSLAGLVLATAVVMFSLLLRHQVQVIRRRSTNATKHLAAPLSSDLGQIPNTLPNCDSHNPTILPRSLFWTVVIGIGAFGSPILNRWQQRYVLLWPLVLWAAFQMTINVIVWTERHTDRRRYRWASRGCGLAFLGTCALYFHLCRSLGYAIEWSFLVGYVPAFPVAVLAAQFLTRRPRAWLVVDLIASGLSFSMYFWGSVAYVKWKLTVGS